MGYGYIQAFPDPVSPLRANDLSSKCECYPVKTFIEKPNSEMARILVDSGEFYWNSGIFVAKTSVLIDEIKHHVPEIAERLYADNAIWGGDGEETFVHDALPYCPNISFDYAVMEKSDKVLMLKADMGWTDVGTWSSMYQLTGKDHNANATIGTEQTIYNDSQGNLVVMKDPKKLVVLSKALIVRWWWRATTYCSSVGEEMRASSVKWLPKLTQWIKTIPTDKEAYE